MRYDRLDLLLVQLQRRPVREVLGVQQECPPKLPMLGAQAVREVQEVQEQEQPEQTSVQEY